MDGESFLIVNIYDIMNQFFVSLLFTLLDVGLTLPGITTQMPVDQIHVGQQQTLNQNTRQIHKGRPP